MALGHGMLVLSDVEDDRDGARGDTEWHFTGHVTQLSRNGAGLWGSAVSAQNPGA